MRIRVKQKYGDTTQEITKRKEKLLNKWHLN